MAPTARSHVFFAGSRAGSAEQAAIGTSTAKGAGLMPYVECERCGLTAFSAAYRFNVEYCARCRARLPRRRSAIESSRLHPPLPRKGRDTPPPTRRAGGA